MTERTLIRSSFTLERDYKAPPERAFQAFADPATKALWFGGPADEWEDLGTGLDFREGGHEYNEGRFHKNDIVSRFDAYYHEITLNERIVYNYEMRINGEKLSVSLASIEFAPNGTGTHLTLSEYGVFFDQLDDPRGRELGTLELLDSLGRLLDA